MKYDRDRLYRLETNTGYAWSPAEPPSGFDEVRAAFRVGDAAVEKLAKPSAASSLYRSGRTILRAADTGAAARLERQAEIARAVAYDRLVRPLRSQGGDYVLVAGGRAWIAYRELPGSLFDGRTCSVESALREAVALLDALGALDADVKPLERVRHEPARWPPALAALAAAGSPAAGETRQLVASNLGELLALAERLRVLELAPVLVHDDLNHSNVLVRDGRPDFLDLEDLRLESRRIAEAHAAFKLARHAVYAGAAEPDAAAVQALAVLPDRDMLFAYGAYRILSEIAAILDDPASFYDLDKKVANLFELYDLLRDGSRADR